MFPNFRSSRLLAMSGGPLDVGINIAIHVHFAAAAGILILLACACGPSHAQPSNDIHSHTLAAVRGRGVVPPRSLDLVDVGLQAARGNQGQENGG